MTTLEAWEQWAQKCSVEAMRKDTSKSNRMELIEQLETFGNKAYGEMIKSRHAHLPANMKKALLPSPCPLGFGWGQLESYIQERNSKPDTWRDKRSTKRIFLSHTNLKKRGLYVDKKTGKKKPAVPVLKALEWVAKNNLAAQIQYIYKYLQQGDVCADARRAKARSRAEKLADAANNTDDGPYALKEADEWGDPLPSAQISLDASGLLESGGGEAALSSRPFSGAGYLGNQLDFADAMAKIKNVIRGFMESRTGKFQAADMLAMVMLAHKIPLAGSLARTCGFQGNVLNNRKNSVIKQLKEALIKAVKEFFQADDEATLSALTDIAIGESLAPEAVKWLQKNKMDWWGHIKKEREAFEKKWEAAEKKRKAIEAANQKKPSRAVHVGDDL